MPEPRCCLTGPAQHAYCDKMDEHHLGRLQRGGPGSVRLLTLTMLAALMNAPTATAQESATCIATPDGALAEIPPVSIGGFYFDFEDRMRAAFPLGSCEDRLLDWMDELDFEDAILSTGDSYFVDEPAEHERNFERLKQRSAIRVRLASRWSLIGTSYYSIAWSADTHGRLLEFYPDTEIMHIDLP